MLVSEINETELSPQLIDKLLFEGLEDTGECVDCIIVLGSGKAAKYRVPIAVEAYHAGRSGKILMCGGKLRDFPDGCYQEAEHMKKAALSLGANERDILLERKSTNTAENLQFALEELNRAFQLNSIRSVLLVTTAYHMRRSLAIAQNIFPNHIQVIPCPADDTNTRRDNWMNTTIGTERVYGEARKIIWYIRNKFIPDIEI